MSALCGGVPSPWAQAKNCFPSAAFLKAKVEVRKTGGLIEPSLSHGSKP